MRVQLSRDGLERGAVAIVAAALATVFGIIAAFTVDFGVAYVSKQQLQAAADAGSLAAVGVYQGETRLCEDLKADEALEAEAQDAADRWGAANRPEAVGTTITVRCSEGALTVEYTVSGSTRTFFGGLAGASDQITTSGTAAATIGKVQEVPEPLRPWGICSTVLNQSGTVTFAPLKDGRIRGIENAECGQDGPPGGWWVAECNGQTESTESIVTSGCEQADEYAPVPDQGPGDLYTSLTTACPEATETLHCLSMDTGIDFHGASDEWQDLVGRTFTMPVFCAVPTCSGFAFTGSGPDTTFGIYRLATVELCGFSLEGAAPSTGWPTTGPCASANPQNYQANEIAGSGFLLVIRGISDGSPAEDWTLSEYDKMRLTQ